MRFPNKGGLGLLATILTLTAGAALAATQAAAKPAPAPKKAAAPAAAPGKPEKVTSVEGITEYRLANGLRVLLFPDPTKPTDHRQHHLPGRLAQRELRRDRAWPTCSSTSSSRERRTTRTSRRS